MTSSNDEIHQADFNRIINPDEYNAEYDDFNKTYYNANNKLKMYTNVCYLLSQCINTVTRLDRSYKTAVVASDGSIFKYSGDHRE